MNLYNLDDIWRLKHPNIKRYTWRQKSPRVHCRLDYFLISRSISDMTVKTDILPSVLSDHSPILLSLKYIPTPTRGRGLWKLNTMLLEEQEYVTTMRDKIKELEQEYKDMIDKNIKWEIVKYEIRRFSIRFSKERRKKQLENIDRLERQLHSLEKFEHENNANIDHDIDLVRNEIKEYELEKANGNIIRSRAEWKEKGERSTKYFFNLEKENYTKKNIKILQRNGIETRNQTEIMNIILDHFQSIYSFHNDDLSDPKFFNQPQIPKLSNTDNTLLEEPITIDECSSVLKTLSLNKSPGNDGLPVEFYNTFWDDIGHILMESYTYSLENGSLTTSQRQAVISLIEKKGKDRIFIDNWRPISLLNVDYKIFSKCIAERIKKVLAELIHPTQTGFVKGRNISDVIRTVMDIVEETDNANREGILLAIDFEKAFDSLSWEFLFKALEAFNFGQNTINTIKVCYNNISSCVINYQTTTRYFDVCRGVRQGDPLSPYLFIICLELLSIYVRNDSDIHGINYGESEVKLLLYADDITATLSSQGDAKRLLACIKEFGKCSGLKINVTKSEGMWLGAMKNCRSQPFQIKWPSTIKLLGIHVGYNAQVLEEKNYRGKINKIKQKLNIWKQRNLTIYGKILIIKAFALSQLLYVAAVCHIPKKIMTEVERIIYEFLWNGKPHKVKTKVIIQDYANGGCKMIDLEEMIKAQKIKMIKRFLSEDEVLWKPTMKALLGKTNLDLYLKSNFLVPKTIPTFYHELLKFWKEIKHEPTSSKEDILNQYLWYNDKIKINQAPIYSRHLDDCGIKKLGHITNDDGSIKSYTDICLTYNIDKRMINPPFYDKIVRAVPANWKEAIQEREVCTLDDNCYVSVNGDKVELQNLGHKELYKALVTKKLDRSTAHRKYTETYNFNEEEWTTIYQMPHTLSISNKAKELHYKIVHGYVATNRLLHKMNIIDSDICDFCDQQEQTLCHLFYECRLVKEFWASVQSWLTTECGVNCDFCLKTVLFGVLEKDNFLNTVICYARLHIMNCKVQKIQICMDRFIVYLENEGAY